MFVKTARRSFDGGKPHTVAAQAAVRVSCARGLECADSLLVFGTGTRSSACRSLRRSGNDRVYVWTFVLRCHNITSLLQHLITTKALVSALLRNRSLNAHTSIISSGKMNICNSCRGKWTLFCQQTKKGESSVTRFIPGRVIASRGKPKQNNMGEISEVNFNAGM